MFLSSCPSVLANEILGTYVTDPGIFPGLKDDGTDQYKSRIEHMTWKLIITDNEVKFYIDKDSEPSIMAYSVVDNFILCQTNESKNTKYVPLYIQNDRTIHGMMTIFYKK